MIANSPRIRSGAAGGLQATARLLGQTVGAALVALIFRMTEHSGFRVALWIAAGCAALAAVISAFRPPRIDSEAPKTETPRPETVASSAGG
jgi:DHA2 family multidrug resistance protein-like MFS transporter